MNLILIKNKLEIQKHPKITSYQIIKKKDHYKKQKNIYCGHFILAVKYILILQ